MASKPADTDDQKTGAGAATEEEGAAPAPPSSDGPVPEPGTEPWIEGP